MFYVYPTLDRSTLDRLLAEAHAAHNARDAIENPLTPEWRAAQNAASAAYRAASAERTRLWKMERWGAWMNQHDRELARITGEL